jgi:hypothetical protein
MFKDGWKDDTSSNLLVSVFLEGLKTLIYAFVFRGGSLI